jgi:hypothetical protein
MLLDFRHRRLRLPPRRSITRLSGGRRGCICVFGAGWGARPVNEVLDAMAQAGVETVVDLDGGQGSALSRQVDRYPAAHPGRFAV